MRFRLVFSSRAKRTCHFGYGCSKLAGPYHRTAAHIVAARLELNEISLQKLILHTCRRVRPGGLTLAIAQNRLPKLAYLEALWREWTKQEKKYLLLSERFC